MLTVVLFNGAVGGVALHQLIKIDQVAVKVGAIYAGKLGLTAHRNTAAAAHTGAVNHNGVQADQGGNFVLFGQGRNKLHHRNRPNGNNKVVMAAAFNQAAQLIGNKAFLQNFYAFRKLFINFLQGADGRV